METKNEAIVIPANEVPKEMPEALKKRMMEHKQNKTQTTLESIQAKQSKAEELKSAQIDEIKAKN